MRKSIIYYKNNEMSKISSAIDLHTSDPALQIIILPYLIHRFLVSFCLIPMLNLIHLPIPPGINRKKLPDKQQKSQRSLLFKSPFGVIPFNMHGMVGAPFEIIRMFLRALHNHY